MDPLIAGLFTKRKRAPKRRIPFSIPLDHALLNLNWGTILRDLRKSSQRKSRPKAKYVKPRCIVRPSTAALPGQPGKRTPPQLRTIVSGARLTGVSKRCQWHLDRLTQKQRQFLNNVNSPADVAAWWHRLYRILPEPIFFVVYTTLRAVV
jgi:hypothetical protein